jgi:hypothetical protein
MKHEIVVEPRKIKAALEIVTLLCGFAFSPALAQTPSQSDVPAGMMEARNFTDPGCAAGTSGGIYARGDSQATLESAKKSALAALAKKMSKSSSAGLCIDRVWKSLTGFMAEAAPAALAANAQVQSAKLAVNNRQLLNQVQGAMTSAAAAAKSFKSPAITVAGIPSGNAAGTASGKIPKPASSSVSGNPQLATINKSAFSVPLLNTDRGSVATPSSQNAASASAASATNHSKGFWQSFKSFFAGGWNLIKKAESAISNFVRGSFSGFRGLFHSKSSASSAEKDHLLLVKCESSSGHFIQTLDTQGNVHYYGCGFSGVQNNVSLMRNTSDAQAEMAIAKHGRVKEFAATVSGISVIDHMQNTTGTWALAEVMPGSREYQRLQSLGNAPLAMLNTSKKKSSETTVPVLPPSSVNHAALAQSVSNGLGHAKRVLACAGGFDGNGNCNSNSPSLVSAGDPVQFPRASHSTVHSTHSNGHHHARKKHKETPTSKAALVQSVSEETSPLSKTTQACVTAIKGHDRLSALCGSHPTIAALSAGLMDSAHQQLGTLKGLISNMIFILLGLLLDLTPVGVIKTLIGLGFGLWAAWQTYRSILPAIKSLYKSKAGTAENYKAKRSLAAAFGNLAIPVLIAILGVGVAKGGIKLAAKQAPTQFASAMEKLPSAVKVMVERILAKPAAAGAVAAQSEVAPHPSVATVEKAEMPSSQTIEQSVTRGIRAKLSAIKAAFKQRVNSFADKFSPKKASVKSLKLAENYPELEAALKRFEKSYPDGIPTGAHAITVKGVRYEFGKPFSIEGGRNAFLAKVYVGEKVYLRMYYASNSAGMFRLLPYISQNYDKAGNEAALTLPSEVQEFLSGIVKMTSHVKQVAEEHAPVLSKYDEGAGVQYMQNDQVNLLRRNWSEKVLNLLESRKKFSSPSQIIIKENLKPNYSKMISEYSLPSKVYGKIRAFVYASKDGSLEYTLFKNEHNQVWFGHTDVTHSDVNVYGLHDRVVDADHGRALLSPLYEYPAQIQPGYQGSIPKGGKGEYLSNWNFVRGIPEIQEWYKSAKMAIPPPDP